MFIYRLFDCNGNLIVESNKKRAVLAVASERYVYQGVYNDTFIRVRKEG